jgi:8-oxo-dGTP diphosphatase
MNQTPPSNDSSPTRPRRRGVVAVVPRGERLLVIQRSALVVAPGAYCFPGGGIEGEETEPVALIREIQEELGLDIVPVRRLWQSVTPWQIELAWWLVRLPAGVEPVPNPAEVAACQWIAPDAMRRLPGLLESNLAFLDALAAGQICLDPAED